MPESRDDAAPQTIDWTGALLATAGLGALVYGLIRLQLPEGRGEGSAFIAAGLVVLALFVVVERRAKHPMMPLGMFASRVFAVANLYTLALYLALGGALYFFPYLLIDVQGYSPTAAGATFLPFVLLQFGFSRWSGGLVPSLGRAPAARAGRGARRLRVSALQPARRGQQQLLDDVLSRPCSRSASARCFSSRRSPRTCSIHPTSALSGMASGINNAVARTAGLLAIALFGIIFTAIFANGFDRRLSEAHVATQTRQLADSEKARFAGGTVPADVPAADRPALTDAVKQGYLAGFRGVQYASAAVSFLAALVAFFLLPVRALPSREAKASHTSGPGTGDP